MVWTKDEIENFKEYSLKSPGKVEAFVRPQDDIVSPRNSLTGGKGRRSWKPQHDLSLRSDGWLGCGSPTGKRRSWKVKEKPIVPNLETDEKA